MASVPQLVERAVKHFTRPVVLVAVVREDSVRLDVSARNCVEEERALVLLRLAVDRRLREVGASGDGPAGA